MTRALLAAMLAVVLAMAPAAFAAPPARVVLVQPTSSDAIAREAATRLRAELAAAGFLVTHVDAAPAIDPRASAEGALPGSRPVATGALFRTDRGVAADVWVADHVTHKTIVRRVDTEATAEVGLPATLAIRAVEMLRISLLEVSAHPEAPRSAPSSPADGARAPVTSAAAPAPLPARPPSRALFERLSLEVGFAALSGLADGGGRLAPTLRIAYGAPAGLAGRLTMVGPTANDQLGMIEAVYGFNRSFRTLAPIVGLGAGAAHTYIDGSGGAERTRLRTRAWSYVLGGTAGVAARAGEAVAFVFDTHVLCAVPMANAIVDAAPAAGKPHFLIIASLGVMASF